MRVRLGVLTAAVGGMALAGAGEAAALEFCERVSNGRACATLTVPLDRAGGVPGAVRLRIERQRALRAARPPLFLIAGGPGQSATEAFDSETVNDIVGTEARSRDVVVMDLRGTGRSGALDCPQLQRGSTRAVDVAACAARLGPARDFFAAADMADDIDAVRTALGIPRVALLGISYGSHIALTYARRHPEHVDRIVLDSVVGPDGIDALERPAMRAAPRVMEGICGARACRKFTTNVANDLTRLAARLERKPLSGLVTDRQGRRHRARFGSGQLLDVVVSADSTPFLRAEVPAAVISALRGDPAPILRTRRWADELETLPEAARQLSGATYVAALCSDMRLPWSSTTPFDARRASVDALIASLPASSFAPFGPTAARDSDGIEVCEAWPSSPRPPCVLSPLPDVPALLIAGTLDARTPVESAQAVADQLPQARLITVGNVGHGVLESSACAGRATRRFLAGGDPGRCGPGRRSLLSRPIDPHPASLGELKPTGGLHGRIGKTVTAAMLTIVDGATTTTNDFYSRVVMAPSPLQMLRYRSLRVGALRGGSYVFAPTRGFLYRRASLVPGVRVGGFFRIGRRNAKGVFRISGKAAAQGRLVLGTKSLTGTLGGRRVRIYPRSEKRTGARTPIVVSRIEAAAHMARAAVARR